MNVFCTVVQLVMKEIFSTVQCAIMKMFVEAKIGLTKRYVLLKLDSGKYWHPPWLHYTLNILDNKLDKVLRH